MLCALVVAEPLDHDLLEGLGRDAPEDSSGLISIGSPCRVIDHLAAEAIDLAGELLGVELSGSACGPPRPSPARGR
jgi:hypothetical protein